MRGEREEGRKEGRKKSKEERKRSKEKERKQKEQASYQSHLRNEITFSCVQFNGFFRLKRCKKPVIIVIPNILMPNCKPRALEK